MAAGPTPKLSSPKASSRSTVEHTSCASMSCPTYPMADACSRSGTQARGRPSNVTSPERWPAGSIAVFRWRSSVVFPQPLTPHTMVKSPGSTAKDTSSSAGAPAFGYANVRCSAARRAIAPPLPR